MKPKLTLLLPMFLVCVGYSQTMTRQTGFLYQVKVSLLPNTLINPALLADQVAGDMQRRTHIPATDAADVRKFFFENFAHARTGSKFLESLKVTYDGRRAFYRTVALSPERKTTSTWPTMLTGEGITLEGASSDAAAARISGTNQAVVFDGPADILALTGQVPKGLTPVSSDSNVSVYSFKQHQNTNGTLTVEHPNGHVRKIFSSEVYFGSTDAVAVTYEVVSGAFGQPNYLLKRDNYVMSKGQRSPAGATERMMQFVGSKPGDKTDVTTFFPVGLKVSDRRLGQDKAVTYLWDGAVPGVSTIIELANYRPASRIKNLGIVWPALAFGSGGLVLFYASFSKRFRNPQRQNQL